MMELQATVYTDRDYLGKLSVIEFGKTLKEFEISAKADPDMGVPDPSEGYYRLLSINDISDEKSPVIQSYGDYVIYFERRLGGNTGVISNCDGKFILAIHGGLDVDDDALGSTDGGIRLKNNDLLDLVNLIGDKKVTLLINEESAGAFGWLTKHKVSKIKPVRIHPNYWNDRVRKQYDDDSDLPYWLMLYYLFFMDQGDVGDIGDDVGIDDGDDSGVIDDDDDDAPIIIDPFDDSTSPTPPVDTEPDPVPVPTPDTGIGESSHEEPGGTSY